MPSFRGFLLASCALALFVAPLASHADTLQLVSTTANSGGGDDVYPYNFSVNGSKSLTSMVCLNLDRNVDLGETWQVNVSHLDLGSSQTAIDYRADAYLFSGFGKNGNSNSDVQYAIWSIFDPAAKNNSHFTSNSQTLVNNAMQAAMDSNIINSGFFQGFLLYAPTSNQTGWTSGQPQEFIAAAPLAATPEPSSLALLGTGLIGTALSFRKRYAAAADQA